MPTVMAKRSARDEATDSPVVWFAVLERGRLAHDFALAARAVQELKRLGVTVKYNRAREPCHG